MAYCPQCGQQLMPGDRFCAGCGATVARPAPAPAAPVAPAMAPPVVPAPNQPAPWPAPPAAVPAVWSAQAAAVAVPPTASDPELHFSVLYPPRSKRWLVFLKWLLVIPNVIVLSIVQFVAGFAALASLVAVLVLGRNPRGLWEFQRMTWNWIANVNAYTWLQRDEYPPFGGGVYPVQFDLAYPPKLARWKVLVRPFALIPHLLCLYLLGMIAGFILLIAGIAILITGKYPASLFDFVSGYHRWQYRTAVYANLLTDRYPPFGLE